MTGQRPTCLAEALNDTLSGLLDTDDSMVLIGQDIGRLGGVFRVTRGLQERFGAHRVRDAVLAESSIVGQAVGMALSGLSPVCEIQFDGFVYPAMNQIITQVAKMRYRWNNDIDLPLVVRVPAGGGIRGVEHHSESNEVHFAHTPGLSVAYPSCPRDAAVMLRHACHLGAPVIFYEPKRLYWRRSRPRRTESVPSSPCGARTIRAGSDITVVGFGAVLDDVLAVADQLSSRIAVEVIDLRWIAPLDIATLNDSVARTRRLLVVHEAVKFAGVGAEIVATIAELNDRDRPLLRRLAPDRRVYPPADFEQEYLVTRKQIATAVEEMCA